VAERVSAIVLAAGASRRFGGDKLLAPLGGQPLLRQTLASFEMAAAISDLVLVVSPDRLDDFRVLCGAWQVGKLRTVCAGGARRRDSVYNGIRATDADWVLVHDGARPLVTPALIDRCIGAALETGAAICGVPVADTLKVVNRDGLIERTVPREGLWAAQTPQVFRRTLLLAAHAEHQEDVTDDAALLERMGYPVWVVEGAPWNIKVTRADDLALAEAILWERGKTEAVGAWQSATGDAARMATPPEGWRPSS
jgi:2-C-methyl-D-erythritol 4-phosphate cytidylyltransferase